MFPGSLSRRHEVSLFRRRSTQHRQLRIAISIRYGEWRTSNRTLSTRVTGSSQSQAKSERDCVLLAHSLVA